MHGRVKVKTTAEQQEAKRLEREKKLKKYTAASQLIFKKRGNKEYDDEALAVTGEILAVNSDFYTLWNYRKEILLHYNETKTEEEMGAIFKAELQFLENCLYTNPKSYGVWHHRCFIVDTMKTADWARELQLCNKYLEYDERNFHCWDYRRFVVKRSNVPPKEELEFTTNKICNNFSNFSSWHYRSKLLPLIYPDENTATGVEEEILLKEYETVQNAFFTDPDDQSAWFYHRWLLGRGEKKTGVSSLYVSRERQLLMITTTQPVLISPASCEMTVLVNGENQQGKWCSYKQETNFYSHIWLFHSSDGSPWLPYKEEVEIHIAADTEEWGIADSLHLPEGTQETWVLSNGDQGSRFSHELSAAKSDTLKRELDSVQELYELEPENKWVLLTIVSLMKALDPVLYSSKIEEFIAKLKTTDATRLDYYSDLRSRFLIENYLEAFDFNSRLMSLPGKGLTSLYHPHLFCMVVKVDLSNNCLTSLKGFGAFQCAREIIVDGNRVEDIHELSFLKELTKFSITNNLLAHEDSLQPLSKCVHLVNLHIEGNPVCQLLSQGQIKQALPSLHNVDGHIFG